MTIFTCLYADYFSLADTTRPFAALGMLIRNSGLRWLMTVQLALVVKLLDHYEAITAKEISEYIWGEYMWVNSIFRLFVGFFNTFHFPRVSLKADQVRHDAAAHEVLLAQAAAYGISECYTWKYLIDVSNDLFLC